MSVIHYDLDAKVFEQLNVGNDTISQWKGRASGMADYVATWGIERFWAMSRSPVLLGGGLPDANQGNDEQRRYFAWGVARVVLCQIVGNDLQIKADMDTATFQNRFRQLCFNQQVLLTDLLIEISDTIQFWAMRMSDAIDNAINV